MGTNFLRLNVILLIMVGDVPVDSEMPVVTFVNLEDSPDQSSKMLNEVGFVCMCS